MCPKGWQQVPQKLGTASIDGDETRDGHSATRTSGWVPGRKHGLAQESGQVRSGAWWDEADGQRGPAALL